MAQVIGNKFNNHSGPSGENFGGRGKFTPLQTAARLELHAKSIATGHPTVIKIAEEWKVRFGIDITVQSEKEWRKSNRIAIEKKKQELIENGTIDVPIVSDRALADNLMTLMIQSGSFIDKVQKKAKEALEAISIEGAEDPEVYKKNKALLMIFDSLWQAHDKNTTGMLKQFQMMSELAGRVKIADSKIAKSDEEFQKKLAKSQDEDFDPVDAEVSEEDRAQAE